MLGLRMCGSSRGLTGLGLNNEFVCLQCLLGSAWGHCLAPCGFLPFTWEARPLQIPSARSFANWKHLLWLTWFYLEKGKEAGGFHLTQRREVQILTCPEKEVDFLILRGLQRNLNLNLLSWGNPLCLLPLSCCLPMLLFSLTMRAVGFLNSVKSVVLNHKRLLLV